MKNTAIGGILLPIPTLLGRRELHSLVSHLGDELTHMRHYKGF